MSQAGIRRLNGLPIWLTRDKDKGIILDQWMRITLGNRHTADIIKQITMTFASNAIYYQMPITKQKETATLHMDMSYKNKHHGIYIQNAIPRKTT